MQPLPVEAGSGALAAAPAAASAALIEQIGDDRGFLPALLGLCSELSGASDVSLLAVGMHLDPPQLLGTASRCGDAARQAGQRYLGEQHYRLDDNLLGLPRLAGRLGWSHLQAAQLPSAAWRAACYEQLGLGERLSLLIPADGRWIVLNAYRPQRSSLSARAAQQGLRSQAPLLAATVRRHLALLQAGAATAPVPAMDRRGGMAAADPLAALSARERQVVQAILAGLSAQQAGRQLGLATTSVATYRQRALQKLGLRRQTDLLRRFGGGLGVQVGGEFGSQLGSQVRGLV